jgi:hypothetical protein
MADEQRDEMLMRMDAELGGATGTIRTAITHGIQELTLDTESIESHMRDGSTMFHMTVAKQDAPAHGAHIAVIDHDAWRLEVEIVDRKLIGAHNEDIQLLLKPKVIDGWKGAIKGRWVIGYGEYERDVEKPGDYNDPHAAALGGRAPTKARWEPPRE